MKALDRKVVVVTGASSGIGLATALELAASNARVVLAARGAAPLEEAAQQCRAGGAAALAVPTDMRDEPAVRELAERAEQEFGGIDAWVNNAAVTAFGRLEDIPNEVIRDVLEINLLGYVHGIRAALPALRRRGGGVVVNVNSGVALTHQPKSAPYVASKAGLVGLSGAVRMDLISGGENRIQVCDVFPASIDTPLFERGANHTGGGIRPLPPVHRPESVAAAIVDVIRGPKREVAVGVPRRTLRLLSLMAPEQLERWIARYADRRHFPREPATEPTDGNVRRSTHVRALLRGGWRE